MSWRKKRTCDDGLRIEETIYSGEDAVVFITPLGQVMMAASIKKITTPGHINGGIKMIDDAEVYVLTAAGTKYRQLYNWNDFRELNRDLCED